MFDELTKIISKPKPFQYYTASELWANEHTSKQMLQYHLNKDVDISSRKISFIDRSVAWIADYFKLGEGKRIVDFGCGPGLYTNRLARTGAKVTGIDSSKNSIEYARSQAQRDRLEVEYVNQNYLKFQTDEKFDLITMIMCDFCALSPKQREQMLGKFRTLLKADGAVLFDVYSMVAFEAKKEVSTIEENSLNGFWSKTRYFDIQNSFKYEDEKIGLDKDTIIEENRTRTVYNWLQYFSPESLTAEFEAAGFKIDKLLGNVAGDSYDPDSSEFAIIARRKL
jgi:SAM-dependent methyltransferase